jgi:hypothetical protein
VRVIPQQAVPTQPSQRTSARRQPRVDLSRLDAASLRKYRRVYKLGELAAGVAKEDLVPAVLRHWQSQVSPPFPLATPSRLSTASMGGTKR